MKNKKILSMSLWQPWASLCVWANPDDGKAEKQIETRSWSTNYRGLAAIHATKNFNAEARFELESNAEMRSALMRQKPHSWFPGVVKKYLTFGAIIGVVQLVDCFLFAPENAEKLKTFPVRELSFGNFERGRYGFVFRNPIEFDEPIPFTSRQGKLLELPEEIEREIFGRLGKNQLNKQ